MSNRHHSVPASVPCILYIEKQSPRGVRGVSYEKVFCKHARNLRRSPVQKCYFNNVAMQRYCSYTSA